MDTTDKPFYLIEQVGTSLWWYPGEDKTRPMYSHSFGRQRKHFTGYWPIDGWTNEATKAVQFKTREEAQKFVDMHNMKDVIVTEHLFMDTDKKTPFVNGDDKR